MDVSGVEEAWRGGRRATGDSLRISVLFSRLSGYMATCLETLVERHGVRLQVVRQSPAANAPFDERHFDWIEERHDRTKLSRKALQATVDEFGPDAVFMSGWVYDDYLRVARTVRRRGVPVVAGTDAQWTGSLRQQAARLAAPWYLHTAIDVLWTAGERQWQLARRLGYAGSRCWSGCYACDWPRFGAVYDEVGEERPRAFLYVGRYLQHKGLDVMVEAYERYRRAVNEPWPLVCAGTGEAGRLLEGREGVEDRGFVQPDALPGLMAEASALVLPSRHEPWGVVVQEAAAAGLALLCSEACGAAVHLLQDGFNGYLCETGNPDHLAANMMRLASKSDEERAAMGHRSHLLSMQYTPERWAETLVHGVRTLKARR